MARGEGAHSEVSDPGPMHLPEIRESIGTKQRFKGLQSSSTSYSGSATWRIHCGSWCTSSPHHWESERWEKTIKLLISIDINIKLTEKSTICHRNRSTNTHPFVKSFEINQFLCFGKFIFIILTLHFEIFTSFNCGKISKSRDVDYGYLRNK